MDVAILSIAVHAALFVACWCYAVFLQSIYRIYHPDHTYLTVIGGTSIVGIAFSAECFILGIDWRAILLFGTLFITAGLPIIRWQRQQAAARARNRSELKREDASHAAQTGSAGIPDSHLQRH